MGSNPAVSVNFFSFKLKRLSLSFHFQLEISSSKCDIKAESSSTLCKFHKGRKGLRPMRSNAGRKIIHTDIAGYNILKM